MICSPGLGGRTHGGAVRDALGVRRGPPAGCLLMIVMILITVYICIYIYIYIHIELYIYIVYYSIL